mgnify:CR=1 FL=1
MRLSHKIVFLVVINLSFGQLCAHAAGPHAKAGSPMNRMVVEVDPEAPLADQLDSMFMIAKSEPVRARELLERLLVDPRFAAQHKGVRHDAYSLSTWLALQEGNYTRALASARQRKAADPDVREDWYPLATLEYEAGNREASVLAIIHLVRTWPVQEDVIDTGLVSQLLYQSELPAPARLGLLEALTQADWMQGRSQNSSLWYELTLMQLLAGRVGQARESAQHVDSPESIVKLRSDRQFDQLIDRNAPRFDVGLAAKNQVETLQRLASATPDSLQLRNELNDAMLTAGMTQAALHHADLILSKMAQMAEEDALFTDMDAKAWTMNNRAVALRRLGRPEEAIQQLETASRLDEGGGANVSQILNLAQLYSSMGRPQQARATMLRLGEALSPYGKMVKASTEHRIAVQTGDDAAAREAMQYLRKHRSTSHSLYLWALLETGQLDQAAELLKVLLASPDDRSEALGWAQHSIEIAPQAADVVPEANFKAVLARPDVVAAIDKVGHVERYPIFVGYMNN